MTRRSIKLLTLENSLYAYNAEKESWDIKEVINKAQNNIDLFESGSYFTCKHMSQKVNPIAFRLNNTKTWNSSWFSNYKYFGTGIGKLQIDLIIRQYISNIFKELDIIVDKIYIKEVNDLFFVRIYIYEEGLKSKKNLILDKKKVSRYKNYIEKDDSKKFINNPFFKMPEKERGKNFFINNKKVINHIENKLKNQLKKNIYISLQYKKDIGESASLLGNYMCKELEKPNMTFKKVLRDSLNKIKLKNNIKGLRVNCSGRLGRAPMAKMEWFKYGSIPLTKINADVDYVQLQGRTKYGSFGIKVWLYKH